MPVGSRKTDSPHLPQSQVRRSLGLRLSGKATLSNLLLVCTEMEPQAENISLLWDNMLGSTLRKKKKSLIAGGAGQRGEDGEIWKRPLWAEGSTFYFFQLQLTCESILVSG